MSLSQLSFVLEENDLCSVYVQEPNGAMKKKQITFEAMMSLLNSSLQDVSYRTHKRTCSPIYPGDRMLSTIQVIEDEDLHQQCYVLVREPEPVDFEYFGQTYKNIGVPKLLFWVWVSNDLVTSLNIFAIKDRFVTPQTQLFAYPFSNVSMGGSVCIGDNRAILTQRVSSSSVHNLLSIPEMFFAMPNSEHSYGHNQSGLYYRDLLTQLENQPFREDWLMPVNMTYEKYISSLSFRG